MYDPMDSNTLEGRFHDQMRKREDIANVVSQGLSMGYTQFSSVSESNEFQINQFLSQNKINVNQAKKMSREEIIKMVKKTQGKLMYSDFSKIILDFQL